jgi:hypothetical protein
MNYSQFFITTLTKLGFDVYVEPNTFVPPYHPESGWPLRLPEMNWKSNSLLVLHCQDFVTITDQSIVELDRVRDHYGEHADRVLVTHMHPGLEKVYHGPINLIEFSSHNYREIHRMRDCWDQWCHVVERPKTQPWQCLNGRKCNHRRQVVNMLSQWGNGMLSYGTDIPLPEWDYGTYRGTENNENFIRLANVYGSCAVNIVTETLYDPVPGLFCEKTLFAMLAQQIPIVIGSQGLVSSIRAHGFDMFDDVVDNSYDNLPNETRLIQALELNKNLIQGKIDLAPYQQRLMEQRKFLLDDYTNIMELRFIRDCKKLASNLNLQ